MAITQNLDSQRFEYTGDVQEFVVPSDGLYKLEVWGGEGGTAYGDEGEIPLEDRKGGRGGYAVGYKYLTSATKLYICVGQKGPDSLSSDLSGGYNGGSKGSASSHKDHVSYREHNIHIGAGGGATHIATVSGLLEDLASYQSQILIVAGGAAGGYCNYEPEENGDEDLVYGIVGGDGGADDAGGFGFGKECLNGDGEWLHPNNAYGAGGGYSAGGQHGRGHHASTGGTNYIGGVPEMIYKDKTYFPSTFSGYNIGNGAAVITLIQRSAPSVYFGSREISAIYYGTRDITDIKIHN